MPVPGSEGQEGTGRCWCEEEVTHTSPCLAYTIYIVVIFVHLYTDWNDTSGVLFTLNTDEIRNHFA